MDLTFLLFDK